MQKSGFRIFRERAVLTAPCLAAISLLLFSQQVIENPEKPLNDGAGRVLRLKEVMRITDTDQKYYFANPIDILVDPSGFIYFQESNKLYVFDPNGKYVYCVLLHGDDVWAVTSRYDGGKELLVDVFNRKGEYIDNFYLQLIGVKKDDYINAPMTAFEDFLFVIQQDEEGLFFVTKYEIAGA